MQSKERLKKLENELADLEQWLNLGLVPEKDLEKHQEEIASLKARIEEESKRLQSLKENGELDEFSAPKRSEKKIGYEGADLDFDEAGGSLTDLGMDMDESFQTTEAAQNTEMQEGRTLLEEDEDPFSDKNRWKRGILDEQDTSQW